MAGQSALIKKFGCSAAVARVHLPQRMSLQRIYRDQKKHRVLFSRHHFEQKTRHGASRKRRKRTPYEPLLNRLRSAIAASGLRKPGRLRKSLHNIAQPVRFAEKHAVSVAADIVAVVSVEI